MPSPFPRRFPCLLVFHSPATSLHLLSLLHLLAPTRQFWRLHPSRRGEAAVVAVGVVVVHDVAYARCLDGEVAGGGRWQL